MVRFAQMGSAYARVVLGIEHPRVGLLGNGTEDEKGSNLPSLLPGHESRRSRLCW